MNTTDMHVAGSLTLAELEQVLHQQEKLNGPLVDLGNAGPNTVLTLNLDDPPFEQPTILRLTPGGVTPTVNGHVLVCQGNCVVNGQLTGVAALRASTKPTSKPAVAPNGALEQSLLSTLGTAETYKDLVKQIANAANIPPEIVAAIGSVESEWGTSALMKPNGPDGTGDRTPRKPRPPLRPGTMPTDGLGFGRGLMQIDWDAHEFARSGSWADPRANITYACRLLASNRDGFVLRGLNPSDAMLAAVAAYNAGFGGASQVLDEMGFKALVASGSYAAKVIARVDFFYSHGFQTTPPATSGVSSSTPGEGPFVALTPMQFLNQVVGDGECVAFVRKAANVPHTSTWTRGAAVKGNTAIQTGTAIATFDPTGRYGNHTDGRSHAAIYLGQDAGSIQVLDQWTRPASQPVHQRAIHFGRTPAVNDGNQFFVIL